MKKGEKGILIGIAVSAVLFWGVNGYRMAQEEGEDRGIPFYTTASVELQNKGSELYKRLACRDCHALWGVRNPMQSVPAPSLDGMGSLRSEAWLYEYFSAEDPQAILPSRLKKKYQMPSFAYLSEEDRKVLAAYVASLKVEDWYLEEAKKSAFEKLTGEEYKPDDSEK